jgi:hypothetical protein
VIVVGSRLVGFLGTDNKKESSNCCKGGQKRGARGKPVGTTRTLEREVKYTEISREAGSLEDFGLCSQVLVSEGKRSEEGEEGRANSFLR